jgi:hypothetical protein
MIDTYFDQVDARSRYKPKRSAPAHEDPLYYNGGIYATMLDRQCAVALDSVRLAVAFQVGHHIGLSVGGNDIDHHRMALAEPPEHDDGVMDVPLDECLGGGMPVQWQFSKYSSLSMKVGHGIWTRHLARLVFCGPPEIGDKAVCIADDLQRCSAARLGHKNRQRSGERFNVLLWATKAAPYISRNFALATEIWEQGFERLAHSSAPITGLT